MKKIELEEIKKIELEILIHFDEFCKEHDIKYSLTGGTLLGAIRHKGFIPWDDDIDIMMNRDQYEKFIKLYSNEGNRYKLITRHNSKKYNYMFSKVVDTNTTLIEDHNYKVKDMGVFIDIFPIDTLGNSYEEAHKKLKKIKYNFYLAVASNWRHYYINKSKGFLRQIPRFIFFILSRFINGNKKYDKIESLFPFDNNAKYFGCACGVYAYKEIMSSDIFKDYIEVEFEGRKFMSIEKYDDYLKGIYNNYMELPPVEMRVTHHTFDAFVKEVENERN